MKRVGFGAECEARIGEVDYRAEGSEFTLLGERYLVPMVGEFNVRNAAAALVAALHAGFPAEVLRDALVRFEGIARRQEVRGEVEGIRVVDDFAHHPTAIKQAIAALRQKFPGARLWVLFEPRSNTTKRNIFQDELAEALAPADFSVVPAIADVARIPEDERLDPARLAAAVGERGGIAASSPRCRRLSSMCVVTPGAEMSSPS